MHETNVNHYVILITSHCREPDLDRRRAKKGDRLARPFLLGLAHPLQPPQSPRLQRPTLPLPLDHHRLCDLDVRPPR